MNPKNLLIILTLSILLVILLFIFPFKKINNFNNTNLDNSQQEQIASTSQMQNQLATSTKSVFSTQGECEKNTGKTCSVQTCDYIPAGKTFEEVCGKDFKKGWVAI